MLWLSKITERWTPVEWQRLWSPGCCQTGWHSTWFTAGGTFEYVSRSCNFFVEKLLTPIARTCPEAYKPSIALHVSGRHKGSIDSGSKPHVPGLVRNGQWICTFELSFHSVIFSQHMVENWDPNYQMAWWLEVHRAQKFHQQAINLNCLNIFIIYGLNFFFVICVIGPIFEHRLHTEGQVIYSLVPVYNVIRVERRRTRYKST